MIKIQRLPAPSELSPEIIAYKTALFKANPKHNPVWKEPYIEKQLMKMSHNKCCYCECILGEESNYMEVEHFHDKNQYPDEVVVWENLLPSCKSCNGSKHNHDTIADPIVNPAINDPKEHLAFRNYRYEGKDTMGIETRDALHLNDSEKKCLPRFRVCNELIQKLEDFVIDVKTINHNSQTQAKNRMIRKVKELLEACQCDREYTAIKATTLVNNPDYTILMNEMKKRGLWIPDLANLDKSMRSYVMDLI